MTLPNMLGFQPDPASNRAPRAWPKFMTARVAADYADASAWTIRRHVRPCGRRGRTLVYAIESVEEWMRGAMPAMQDEMPATKGRRTTTARPSSEHSGDRANRDRGGGHVDVQNDHVAA